MRRRLPEILAWAACAGLPAVAFVALRVHPAWDRSLAAPTGRFFIVSAVSITSFVLAAATAAAARRLADARALLLAMAFLAMSGCFAVHGLATPGFVVGREYGAVTGFAARLGVLLAAVLLAASAFEPPAYLREAASRHTEAIASMWVVLLGAFAAVALARPATFRPDVVEATLFVRATLVVTLLAAGVAAYRYSAAFRRSRLATDGVLGTSAVLIAEAQVGVYVGATWASIWWLYHVAAVGGFAVALWAIATAYVRGDGPTDVIRQLTRDDPLELIQSGFSEAVRTFATSLEARDRYTHGHGRRVAILAVLIAQELGLSPERLRALSQGALLHDVGKIAVPDDILNKPGSLTDDELGLIRQHPAQGAAMLSAMVHGRVEDAVIRHHHEWFDGTGYPDGLAGEAIPLEARITAIADVYDALRSTRSYRPAWTASEARAHVHEQAGTHFDPACIAAFDAVADRFERDHSWEVEQRRAVVVPAVDGGAEARAA